MFTAWIIVNVLHFCQNVTMMSKFCFTIKIVKFIIWYHIPAAFSGCKGLDFWRLLHDLWTETSCLAQNREVLFNLVTPLSTWSLQRLTCYHTEKEIRLFLISETTFSLHKGYLKFLSQYKSCYKFIFRIKTKAFFESCLNNTHLPKCLTSLGSATVTANEYW